MLIRIVYICLISLSVKQCVQVSSVDLRSHCVRRSHTSLVSVESAHFWGRDFQYRLQGDSTRRGKRIFFTPLSVAYVHAQAWAMFAQRVTVLLHRSLFFSLTLCHGIKHAYTHRLHTHTHTCKHAQIQMPIKGTLHHVSSHYLRSI